MADRNPLMFTCIRTDNNEKTNTCKEQYDRRHRERESLDRFIAHKCFRKGESNGKSGSGQLLGYSEERLTVIEGSDEDENR